MFPSQETSESWRWLCCSSTDRHWCYSNRLTPVLQRYHSLNLFFSFLRVVGIAVEDRFGFLCPSMRGGKVCASTQVQFYRFFSPSLDLDCDFTLSGPAAVESVFQTSFASELLFPWSSGVKVKHWQLRTIQDLHGHNRHFSMQMQ